MQLNADHLSASAALARDSYHDVNNLQQLKSSQLDSGVALDEIGKQFESLLVHQMLKSMRSASNVWAKDSLFNSERTAFYQEMLDDQMSVEITRSQDLGLAKKIAIDLQSVAADPVEKKTSTEASAENAIDATKKSSQKLESLPFGQVQKAYYASALKVSKIPVQLDSEVQTQSVVSTPVDATLEKSPKQAFDNAETFIAEMMPLAKKASEALNVPAEVLVAQAALETGWGKHVIQKADGSSSHNLFGIKADSRWAGDSASVQTLEYFGGKSIKINAQFRSYDSHAESFDDYVRFIQNNDRYQPAIAQSTQYTKQLQQAGYATDPNYAEKINRIVERVTISNGSAVNNSVGDNSPINSSDLSIKEQNLVQSVRGMQE